ncbi:hypothetical protein [Mucilaginibacter sp. UYCu711]|uniref:hypothetical protein n=1 Tax=Mucilaginibacter sp. UYCu711 TaxID=3156339 RepID=UPI003D258554
MSENKKQWQKPEIYLLSSNPVQNGIHVGTHEHLITHSSPGASTFPGKFILFTAPGKGHIRNHTKNYYAS